MVNGITSVTTGYEYYNSASKAVSSKEKSAADTGVVYEKSDIGKMSKADRDALVKRLQSDTQNRVAQLESLVQKMFKQQGVVIGTSDELWRKLAQGNFTADADTIAKAKEDISEDGYWGVTQTSERIFDFAMALAGDDVDKMKEMQEAFEKGFKQATGTWGKELPDISSKTYDAVNKKFEDYYSQKGVE